MGNVTTLLMQTDIELKQVISLDPDSRPLTKGMAWDEEMERAPHLLLK